MNSKRRAQLQDLDFIVTDGAGRFRRGLAHMKTNTSNFFVLVVTFLLGWFLFFFFPVQKTETVLFLKIPNRIKKK